VAGCNYLKTKWPDRMRRPVSSAGCDMLPMRNAL
jgi:hypothetical protein